MSAGRLVIAALFAVALVARCGGPVAPAYQGDREQDAGAVPPVNVVDSGCPAVVPVTPNDVPAGFSAAVRVELIRPIDGDTADFRFASGEETVRFLYVNTEESYGTETTAFGTETSRVVARYLNEAREIAVAVQESSPGQPKLDPYRRWLGLVFVDGELFQTRIVREGWSAYYTQYGCAPEPMHKNLLYAEAEANAKDVGIWRAGHPTDYQVVLRHWIGSRTCRPNPFDAPYCR